MTPDAGEHRLHPYGIVLIAARRLRRWSGLLLPALAAAVVAVGMAGIVAIGVVVSLVGLVIGLAQWRRFTYGVDGDTFVVHRGVFEHETRTVPLTRVQSIDVHQGAIDRLIGARRLTLRTAAGGANVELPAVSAVAEAQLRQALGETAGTVEREDVVRALAPRELPLIALTSPRVLGGIAVLAAVASRLGDLGLGNVVVNVEGELEPHTVVAIVGVIAGLLVFTALASLIGTVVALWNFRIVRDGERLRMRRGLLSFRETVIPVDRARAVQVRGGLLREPLDRCSLSVRTAGRGSRSASSAVLFPLLRTGESGPLVRETVPALDLDGIELEQPPRRARGRYVRRAVLPWLLVAAVLTPVWGPVVGIVPLVAVPLAALLGLARFRAAGFGHAGGRVRWRRRGLARHTLVARSRSVQWRRVRQSPFQRRRSLATLEVGLATGGVEASVRDLDAGAAGRLARALGPPITTNRYSRPGTNPPMR
jgi:putative membrane protein